MRLGTARSFGAIVGVRESDRSLGGANPQVDSALYEILYALSEVTREPRYAAAADAALGFFFQHCQSPATGLMAWGEHLYWDFETESCRGIDRSHEVGGEWPFWDQCYRLAPEACWRFAIGQWDHQIADQQTGDFSRHAQYSKHGPQKGSDFPRYAGQMILNWADAHARPDNARRERRAELIDAITVVVGRMENNMRRTPTGYLPALAGEGRATLDFALKTAGAVVLDPFVVEAVAEGQAKAINQQRNSDTILAIISADAAGALPDQTIGQALNRLAGVNVVDDTDVSIRGADSALNTITLDGIGLTTPRAGTGGDETRAFDLSSIPTEMIETTEVYKVLTPDMPANSFGGTVNLKTRSSLDYKRAIHNASLEYQHDDFRANYPKQPGTYRFTAIYGRKLRPSTSTSPVSFSSSRPASCATTPSPPPARCGRARSRSSNR